MITVHKYELQPQLMQTIRTRRDVQLLHADTQGPNKVMLWAKVDTDAPQESRRIVLVGTGHPMPGKKDGLTIEPEHVGSFLMHGGMLVWHVFDGGPVI